MPRRRSPWATAVGVLGELLLTAGALVLLFVVYLLWGTGLQTAQAQDDLEDELSELWSEPAEVPPPAELANGDAYGYLRIPRFGDDYKWTIVQGVEDEDLKRGPGHYPDTPAPGDRKSVV